MNIASEKTVEGISGIAFLRKCVIAPRKMRMVADLIRGKNVVLALNILKNYFYQQWQIIRGNVK